MRATGIVRRVDDLGRFVIPKELRNTLNIKEGDSLEIFTDDDKVIFKKYKRGCIICNNTEKEILKAYENVTLCKICIEMFSSL